MRGNLLNKSLGKTGSTKLSFNLSNAWSQWFQSDTSVGAVWTFVFKVMLHENNVLSSGMLYCSAFYTIKKTNFVKAEGWGARVVSKNLESNMKVIAR